MISVVPRLEEPAHNVSKSTEKGKKPGKSDLSRVSTIGWALELRIADCENLWQKGTNLKKGTRLYCLSDEWIYNVSLNLMER
mmetsp:Transcript_13968/g.23087  ORF Transcript_13968/g.23087 Transcript_13968/m.23087 type:complete len:82 (+) Transcript_13968:75-320(+)